MRFSEQIIINSIKLFNSKLMRKIMPLIVGFALFTLYEAIDFNARNLELKRIKTESYQTGVKHGIFISGTALNNTLDMTNRDKKIYSETVNEYLKQHVKELCKYNDN